MRVACVDSLLQAGAEAALPALRDAFMQEVAPPVQLELALALLRFRDQAQTALAQALSRSDLCPVARSVISDALLGQPPSV